jgi:hypothetical protein
LAAGDDGGVLAVKLKPAPVECTRSHPLVAGVLSHLCIRYGDTTGSERARRKPWAWRVICHPKW